MTTSTSLVTGVDFITVPTKDFDEAFEFYGEVVGLEFSKRWGDMPGAEFETGTLTIAVMQSRRLRHRLCAAHAPDRTASRGRPRPPRRAGGKGRRLRCRHD